MCVYVFCMCGKAEACWGLSKNCSVNADCGRQVLVAVFACVLDGFRIARCQLPVAIFVTQQGDAGNKNLSEFLSFSFCFAAMLHWPYVALGVPFDFEGSHWPRFQTQHSIYPSTAAIQLSVWDIPNP